MSSYLPSADYQSLLGCQSFNQLLNVQNKTQPIPPSNVNHPSHYNQNPSGIECIDVVEHLPYNIGNAIKYLWRADLKQNHKEDLEKAIWCIQREISRVHSEKSKNEKV